MRNNEQNYTGQRRQGEYGRPATTQKKIVREINKDNYVEEAENVILEMKKMKDRGEKNAEITTTQLRNLLAMAADIYNTIMHQNSDALTEEIKSRIEYMKVRFFYEAGRNDGVKTMIEEANLMGVLKNIKGSRENYILFNRYMEALVAFHRYHGGKDN
jgi:CRISPR-associated protein Csm2